MVKKSPVVVPMQCEETYTKISQVSAPLKTAQKEQTETKVKKNDGIKSYYKYKIETLQLIIQERTQNLRRLEAQRNELNAKVRMLREEIMLLQEQGSYVGEVIKPMDKKKC